jgi:archaeal preflagellin peptidase FlaK
MKGTVLTRLALRIHLILDLLLLNIAVASAMLLFTSYLDIRKREVQDKVWIIFGSIGIAIQLFEIYVGFTNTIDLLISVGIAAVIGLGIYFFGFYGGADGKALIVLGIIVPVFHPAVGLYSFAPIMTLTNGILLSVLLPFGLMTLNLLRVLRGQRIFSGFEKEPAWKKILACFLGYKATGKPRNFQFPMEKSMSDPGLAGEKRFDFSLMSDDFETRPGTWVTPGIPLLVFFTAGFFLLLAYGDLVIGLIQFAARLI